MISNAAQKTLIALLKRFCDRGCRFQSHIVMLYAEMQVHTNYILHLILCCCYRFPSMFDWSWGLRDKETKFWLHVSWRSDNTAAVQNAGVCSHLLMLQSDLNPVDIGGQPIHCTDMTHGLFETETLPVLNFLCFSKT